MKKRIISFFLSLTLMVTSFALPSGASLVVPPVGGALAVPGGVALGTVGVVTAPALALGVGGLVSFVSSILEYSEEQVQAVLDVLVSEVGYGNVGKEHLEARCNFLNQISANPFKYSDLLYQDGLALGYFGVDITDEMFVRIISQITAYQSDLNNWHIIYHQDYGYVIANASETFILADSIGRYPYYLENTDMWMPIESATKNASLHVATQYMLDNLQAQQKSLHPDYSISQGTYQFSDGNRYKVLFQSTYAGYPSMMLCDQDGFPYGIPEGNTQMGADRDYNNDKDNQPEVKDEPIVDIDGDLVMQMFPDGSWTWINSLIYDASEKTYYVNASTSYNTENNTYYNYEWHYTYHINYTSITYIGQTAEYDKVYEYYYDLPDGRSSADLTADELLALNVAVDILPYIRSADDVNIRALYHFDGDTRDSSYWSHLGKFTWNKGASITYMDAGAFEGALYLDENEHDFTIELPSAIGSGDFTMQFRYYQSHTLTPAVDSYLDIGGDHYLCFSGQGMGFFESWLFLPLSVGQWQEICVMYKSGTFYYFHNGVLYNTYSTDTVLDNTIYFHFGSEQQIYKYFDEFRFVSEALYDASGYTPTSVPYDTNLALVLPDSQLPVADEYWHFNTEGNMLKYYDFTQYYDYADVFLDVPGRIDYRSWDNIFEGLDYSGRWVRSYGLTGSYDVYAGLWHGASSDFWFIRESNSKGLWSGDTSVIPADVFILPLWHYDTEYSDSHYLAFPGIVPGGTYTFSVMYPNAVVDSFTFKIPASAWSNEMYLDQYHDLACGGRVGLYTSYIGSYVFCSLWLQPPVDGPIDFGYMELVEGTQANTGHEFVSSVVVMDKDDLNTPSLAVRTDLEITGHQLGGVRPSLPEKGLVWAMVEGGRITSLQIYNGQAWEQVDGRIWTGERWVPYYAYDLLLLKDLYDIVESDPTIDYIYTEAGFWKWLQSAWSQMMKKLDAIIAALGGYSGDSMEQALPGGADNPETEMDEGWKFIDLLAVLRDGAWSVARGVVSVGVGGFTGLVDSVSDVGHYFDLYEPANSDGVLGIFTYKGDDLWA